MSLFDETIELSQVYHGQRARMQALEELLREYHALVDIQEDEIEDKMIVCGVEMASDTFNPVWKSRRDVLQQRTKALLEEGK